ncbi:MULTISPECIES: MspA family porin [unclassified Rhodococcus (in: high G+C Gram-positive bacteria)]|uniref:MspA family porin n=1 Tax=unclassified Rhodococcus (in: high G+C Gram-positive bacteria) TaxID=192944 RepID=UPI00163A66B5|nr:MULTISPECIES: MspA family porin [unclassified Rhodococcus (in: high G+C Gram-positive bacteria)]MBC2642884.1 MspA family porin [Rhodococcus sp. 3A]MBC2892374.1 MspA family porin [Rhodococcus sp. 4CII]
MIINRKNGVRLAAVGAAAAATMGFFSVGAANADTFIPLPGGSITQTLADGTVVTVNLTDESANISPSMGSTPLHRNVWVNGKAAVTLDGAGAKGATITPGYILACQVDFGAKSGGSANAFDGTDPKSGIPLSTLGQADAPIGFGGSGNGGITLGPGQAKNVTILDLEKKDAYGGESHTGGNKFTGKTGSVTWADSTLGVSGCAGYAQARSYVKVAVSTDNVSSTVTLWGQPFSIG